MKPFSIIPPNMLPIKKINFSERCFSLFFLIISLHCIQIPSVFSQSCHETFVGAEPFEGSAEDFSILCSEAKLVLSIEIAQFQEVLCPSGCFPECIYDCETLTLDETGHFTAKATVFCQCRKDLLADCSATPESQPGANDGTASAVVSGGTPPYTYHWSNGGSSSTITGLTAGTYACDVTDASGNTTSCEAQVDVESQCVIVVSIMNPIVSKGQKLTFSVIIHHNRLATVTTPVYIAIYDQAGNIVQSFTKESYTFEYGDMITVNKSIQISSNFNEGTYYLKAGVGEMKQGTIKKATAFQVVQ